MVDSREAPGGQEHSADVVVVGMGPGGEALAGHLASSGVDVVGVEHALVGGECPYWACIPTKMMVRAGDVLAETRRVERLAGRAQAAPDFAPVARRIRKEATSDWDDTAAAERFTARHEADDAALIRRAWDLEAVGRSYQRWHTEARQLVDGMSENPSDEEIFAVRSRLVHEWRKFLFTDPGLPRSLLPDNWPGDAAAEFFDEQAERLLPAAARFVDRCLSEPHVNGA